MSSHFYVSDNKEDDKRLSEGITNRTLNEFNDIFFGIGWFKGTFSLQVEEDNSLYQAPPKGYTQN